jgi:hypothetical protein
MPPCVLDRSLLGLSHPVLDLGEGLLDWIEIGGVWRQVPEPGTGFSDHRADSCRFVGAEIVHDDDVAWLQDWHELLFDISAETPAIDRSIKYAWCGEPVAAQRPKEGQRAPVAVRCEAAQALALRAPASQRGHVGLDPCLVDKDQSARIEPALPGTPALAPAGDIGAGLLKGEQRFF